MVTVLSPYELDGGYLPKVCLVVQLGVLVE